MKRNKKGSIIFDSIWIIVFLVAFGLITIISYMLYTNWVNDAGPMLSNPDNVNSNLFAKADTALKSLDYMFIFIIVGLTIMLIISAFSIQSHPIFFFISLIALVVIIIISAQFSNVFHDITHADEFINSSNQFSLINKVMDKLPFYITLMVIITLIVLYGKSKYDIGGGV
jgi:hypothetical protein